MKRKARLFFIVLVILLSGLNLTRCSSAGSKPVNMGELESLKLLNLDSTQFQMTEGKMKNALLAVVFNPTCEHCQAEAQQIRNNMKQFEDISILMIGSAPLKEMTNFSINYGLNNFDNVDFVYTSPLYGYQLFGAIQLPHVRIYDKNFTLIKGYSGPTSMDEILSQIKK